MGARGALFSGRAASSVSMIPKRYLTISISHRPSSTSAWRYFVRLLYDALYHPVQSERHRHRYSDAAFKSNTRTPHIFWIDILTDKHNSGPAINRLTATTYLEGANFELVVLALPRHILNTYSNQVRTPPKLKKERHGFVGEDLSRHDNRTNRRKLAKLDRQESLLSLV